MPPSGRRTRRQAGSCTLIELKETDCPRKRLSTRSRLCRKLTAYSQTRKSVKPMICTAKSSPVRHRLPVMVPLAGSLEACLEEVNLSTLQVVGQEEEPTSAELTQTPSSASFSAAVAEAHSLSAIWEATIAMTLKIRLEVLAALGTWAAFLVWVA